MAGSTRGGPNTWLWCPWGFWRVGLAALLQDLQAGGGEAGAEHVGRCTTARYTPSLRPLRLRP